MSKRARCDLTFNLYLQPNMSTADRKKKNFSFSRKFPFMKSKDQIGSDEQLSTEERKFYIIQSSV